jgi:hypothetical protein
MADTDMRRRRLEHVYEFPFADGYPQHGTLELKASALILLVQEEERLLLLCQECQPASIRRP